jgi:hypothetical protein
MCRYEAAHEIVYSLLKNYLGAMDVYKGQDYKVMSHPTSAHHLVGDARALDAAVMVVWRLLEDYPVDDRQALVDAIACSLSSPLSR